MLCNTYIYIYCQCGHNAINTIAYILLQIYGSYYAHFIAHNLDRSISHWLMCLLKLLRIIEKLLTCFRYPYVYFGVYIFYFQQFILTFIITT